MGESTPGTIGLRKHSLLSISRFANYQGGWGRVFEPPAVFESGGSKTRPQPPIRPFSLRDDWLLLPILVLATLLRLWQIDESLWLDELHSAWVVASGPTEIVERAQIGNQSPFYFYLPWATTALFGMSEWALRLPSLVAGVGLVVLAYGLACQFTRSRVAAVACSILAALDHNFLFYATEARPYACVQLIAAVQLYIFWRLQDASPVRRRVAFVAANVVLFYLHYTAILLVAGEVVYMLTRSWCGRQRMDALKYTRRKLAIDLLCVAAMALPTAAHILDIGARRNAWAMFVNNTSLLLPANWFSLDSYIAVPLVICLIIGVFKVAITLRRDEPSTWDSTFKATFNCCSNTFSSGSSRRSVTATFLLVCWFVTPLSIVWLLTVTDVARLYLARYVIGAALAPVLFAGLCIGFCGSKRTQAIVAGTIMAYAVYSSGMFEQVRYDGRLFGDRDENWRDAVRYVNDGSHEGPVFVRSGLLEANRLTTDKSELLRDYCRSPVTSIYDIDRPASEILPLTTGDAGKLTKEDVKRIEAANSAWFIINGTTATHERCTERILESLANEGGKNNVAFRSAKVRAFAERKTTISRSHSSLVPKEIQRATHSETQRGLVLDERQFGHVKAFAVLLVTIDDQVTPLDDQPTSPNSIAPP